MAMTTKTPDQIADAILDRDTGTGRDIPDRYRDEVRELLLEAARTARAI